MRWLPLLLLLSSIGCAPVPTCSEAADNYYGEGCVFLDGATGEEFTESGWRGICRDALVATPEDCEGEFDDWLVCLGEIEGGTNSMCQSCDREQEDWARCAL